jgi:glycyl-tRNA synthetase (class II)
LTWVLLLLLLLLLQAAEDMLAGVGEMGAADLDAALTKFGVVAPDTKNPISPCFPFNLMFKTSIGPKGDLTGYLRPETAQVCLLCLLRVLHQNHGCMSEQSLCMYCRHGNSAFSGPRRQ